jgi:hypothetical protein
MENGNTFDILLPCAMGFAVQLMRSYAGLLAVDATHCSIHSKQPSTQKCRSVQRSTVEGPPCSLHCTKVPPQRCGLPAMPQQQHHLPAAPAGARWSSAAGPLLAGPLLAPARNVQLLLALLLRRLPFAALRPPLPAPPAVLAVSQGSGGAEIFRFEKSRPGGMTRMMGK